MWSLVAWHSIALITVLLGLHISVLRLIHTLNELKDTRTLINDKLSGIIEE